MLSKPLLVLLFFFASLSMAVCQTFDSPSFWNMEKSKSFTVQFDNDTYFLTDYYYTVGLQFELTLPAFNKSPIMVLFPKVGQDRQEITGLAVIQRLYTPKNIRDTAIQFNDRPFAATLELNHYSKSFQTTTGWNIFSGIKLGILGPAAGGAALQQKIHDWIDSPEANGWKYQVANDVIINYEIAVDYPLVHLPSLCFSTTASGRVGTLFDDLSMGFHLVGGKYQFIKHPPFPNKKQLSNKKLKPFFSINALAKYVLFNATMQGGVFSKRSPYVLNYSEISTLVFSTNATVGVSWYDVMLQIGYHYLSKEFIAGSNHQYASIALSIYF